MERKLPEAGAQDPKLSGPRVRPLTSHPASSRVHPSVLPNLIHDYFCSDDHSSHCPSGSVHGPTPTLTHAYSSVSLSQRGVLGASPVRSHPSYVRSSVFAVTNSRWTVSSVGQELGPDGWHFSLTCTRASF